MILATLSYKHGMTLEWHHATNGKQW